MGPEATYLLPIEYVTNGPKAITSGPLGEKEDDELFAAKRAEGEKHPDAMPEPLNFDELTLLGFTNANSFPYSNSLAVLDGNGESTASFTLLAGLNPGFAGTTLHHSFITIFGGTGADFASNPVPVLLVP